MKQRFIKACLVLLRNNKYVEVIVELRLCLRLCNMAAVLADIERGLGKLLRTVLNCALEGCQNVHIRILMFLDVSFYLVKIAYSCKSRIGNNHHFTLAADLETGSLTKSLNDDSGLLADIIRMELLILLDQFRSSAFGEFRILGSILRNLEAGAIGHVVTENIKYEAFLDSLTHTVYMERVECSVSPGFTEHLQCLSLGSCSKCKELHCFVSSLSDAVL